MSHAQIIGPQPKAFNPANSNSCAYCQAILAYTLDGKNYGLLGIQAIYEAQEACENRSGVKLVNVRKKPGALFAK